ncbi:hypothetical protein J7L85_00450, partial [candidate division WOR-3 bacterium]|nr:hypothetical protein [candidate division WOR-3 bacterium]
MAEEIIETLLAEKGHRYEEDGQTIASYGRSIVFLPKDCEPGKSYRLKLQEIREDSRGRMMYRGIPAPDISGELWEDNSDGTASLWETTIDWLGNAVKTAKIGEQQLQSQEKVVDTKTDYQFIWGNDLQSSIVKKTITQTISHQTETVKSDGSGLEWTETSKEERVLPIESYYLHKMEIRQDCGLPASSSDKFAIAYEGDWKVYLDCKFDKEQKNSSWHKWNSLPDWIKDEVQKPYPVCSCGRQRYDKNNPDGYQKCDLCRQEEVCIRCGKQKKVTNLNGRLICDDCKPYEEQEQLIAKYLTDAH